jgi:hypothetical protein
MTAIAAVVWKTNLKQRAMTFGPHGVKGASIKVIKVTPATDNYSAAGVTLDLSAHFPERIYWCVPMNATVRNATTGYMQVGYVPGTAKTDKAGGFASTDGKYQFSAGATEDTASDNSAYVIYFVVCGC